MLGHHIVLELEKTTEDTQLNPLTLHSRRTNAYEGLVAYII